MCILSFQRTEGPQLIAPTPRMQIAIYRVQAFRKFSYQSSCNFTHVTLSPLLPSILSSESLEENTKMFCKKSKARLKEIEEWPATLEGFGLFINEHDQIRAIGQPEQKSYFKVSNSHRYNERRYSALRRISPFKSTLNVDVLSNIAVERCLKLGMRKLAIPLGVSEDEPHTHVLISADFETNTYKLAVLVIALLEMCLGLDTICGRLGDLGEPCY